MKSMIQPIAAACIALLFAWLSSMKVSEAVLLYFILTVWFETMRRPATPPVSGKDKEGES